MAVTAAIIFYVFVLLTACLICWFIGKYWAAIQSSWRRFLRIDHAQVPDFHLGNMLRDTALSQLHFIAGLMIIFAISEIAIVYLSLLVIIMGDTISFLDPTMSAIIVLAMSGCTVAFLIWSSIKHHAHQPSSEK